MNEYFITITSRLPPISGILIRGLLTKEKFHLFRPAVIRKKLNLSKVTKWNDTANSRSPVLSPNKPRPGEHALLHTRP